MWIADNWKDYEVIDCSKGEKLERWGSYILVRPDPQVIWDTPKNARGWKHMNGHYHRSKKGGGEWEFFCEPISNADVRAQTCINDSARQVKFQMNMHTHDSFNWDYKDLQKTAFHEVCEVLLYDLERIACLEGISAEQKEAMLIRTRHKVIHHLEKLFYLMDETDTIDSMRKNIITPTEV